jgi:phosphoserine phosphatase
MGDFKDIDLVILDADGTIAPHMTVAIASEAAKALGIKAFCSRASVKEKRLQETAHFIKDTLLFLPRNFRISTQINDHIMFARICFFGVFLYCIRYLNNMKNSIGMKADNKFLTDMFVYALRGIRIRHFFYTQKEVEESMYPGAKEFLDRLKARKVMISQSFSFGNNFIGLYKNILKLDEIVCNAFVAEDGKITGGNVVVSSAEDKRRIALAIIRKHKAKHVCLLCNDYEDAGIAELPEVKLVIANNPARRLRRLADAVVYDDYRSLLT